MQDRTFVMSGRVSDFGIDGILQMVSLSRQFTAIELMDEVKHTRGVIFLKSGQIVAARAQHLGGGPTKGQLEGKSAFLDLYRKPSEFFDVFRLEALSRYPNPLGPIPKMLLEAQQSQSTSIPQSSKSSVPPMSAKTSMGTAASIELMTPERHNGTMSSWGNAVDFRPVEPRQKTSFGHSRNESKIVDAETVGPSLHEFVEQVEQLLEKHAEKESQYRDTQRDLFQHQLRELEKSLLEHSEGLQELVAEKTQVIEQLLDTHFSMHDSHVFGLKEELAKATNQSSTEHVIEMVKLLSPPSTPQQPQQNPSSVKGWVIGIVAFQFVLLLALAILLIVRSGS